LRRIEAIGNGGVAKGLTNMESKQEVKTKEIGATLLRVLEVLVLSLR
jgi:hypothetical protein